MRILSRALLAVMVSVVLGGCGYSPVRPYSGRDFSLGVLRNSTDEPLLNRMMEGSLQDVAGLRRNGALRKVSIVLNEFSERALTVSFAGDPVREEVMVGFVWRVEGGDGKVMREGNERVTRSYLWSPDINTLDWNRRAAIKLLSDDAAGVLSDRLEDLP